MKRTLAFLLVLVLALCLFAGCAKKQAEVTLPAPVAAASDMEFENDSAAADVAAGVTYLSVMESNLEILAQALN